jgi:hypothetical protein
VVARRFARAVRRGAAGFFRATFGFDLRFFVTAFSVRA